MHAARAPHLDVILAVLAQFERDAHAAGAVACRGPPGEGFLAGQKQGTDNTAFTHDGQAHFGVGSAVDKRLDLANG
jgi:hypothetical protein